MANITKEQILKIKNMCSNGWRFDAQYYIYYNEKTLIKEVKLDDENFLEFTLRYNYKNQVSLHISKFYQAKGKEYASTNGMGKSRILEEVPVKRKSINNLIKFTKDLNDEKLLEINKNTKMATGYGLIESSDNF